MTLSDLIFRHKKRRLEQFEAWFCVHKGRLLAYACRQADQTTDRELLLAEVMTRVSRIFCRGKLEESELLPYCLRSIRNAAIAARQKNIHRHEAERRYSGEEAYLASLQDIRPPEGEELRERLRRAAAQLPGELRDILMMKLWEEQSFNDIARQLHLPKTSVQRRYAAAIASIRNSVFPTPGKHLNKHQDI